MFWARIRCDELDGKRVFLPFGAGIFVPFCLYLSAFFGIPQIIVPLGMICMIQRDDCAVSRTGPFLDWTLPRIQSLPYLPTTPFAMHESRLLSSILPPSLFLISACARITSSS